MLIVEQQNGHSFVVGSITTSQTSVFFSSFNLLITFTNKNTAKETIKKLIKVLTKVPYDENRKISLFEYYSRKYLEMYEEDLKISRSDFPLQCLITNISLSL